MWMLSLANAIKNGFIASEILEGKLTDIDFSKLKNGYFTNEWFYTGSLPEFYKKYGTVIENKRKKDTEEKTFLSILLPKISDKPISIGDVFYYDRANDVIKNKSGEVYWNGIQAKQNVSSGLYTTNERFGLKEEIEVKSDTPLTVTDGTKSGANYYLTAPVRSEETKNKVSKLQKEIDEASYYIQNLNDEDINKQEIEFVQKYIDPLQFHIYKRK